MNVKRILQEEFKNLSQRPFIWGETDCFRTACLFTKAVMGYDPGAHLLGTYDSEFGALRVMAQHEWNNVGDVAASIFEEIPPAFAQTGDWAYVVQDNMDGLGVVLGWQVILRHIGGDMGFLPLTRAKRAFRVV